MSRQKTNWNGKRIIVVGAGRQGQALARFMATNDASVVITDQAPIENLNDARCALNDLPIRWVSGGHPISLLDNADAVSVSGGADLRQPFLVAAKERNIPLINDTEVFLNEVSAPVIGITGSAGKTTTTTLVGRIASAEQELHPGAATVYVGGNIGNPLVTLVDEIKPNDCVILELSSFQLDLTTISPQVAAVLNITPNHLDRHGTMEAYIAAKRNILAFQSPSDLAVLSRDDAYSNALRSFVRGKIASFGFAPVCPDDTISIAIDGKKIYALVKDSNAEPQRIDLMTADEITLRGSHNLSNVMAAACIALSAGFGRDAIRAGIIGFNGVAHRLEYVGSIRGARYYNDSIATAPERTLAAVHSFDEPMILLLGGRDKNLPWDDLAREIVAKAKGAVCFGEAGPMIAKTLKNAQKTAKDEAQNPNGELTIVLTKSLSEALKKTTELIEAGDVVILSPGGTSYDAYKNFEERGNEFRSWVSSQA